MARGSQLLRQWQLLRVLESFKFGISVEELVNRVECSRRTVERDRFWEKVLAVGKTFY
ncbi:MAG: hypothetical protein ACYSUL_08980 [Planctomycetota bacterium]|jgi:predicted DNA-binding transcriptional regulator YafY